MMAAAGGTIYIYMHMVYMHFIDWRLHVSNNVHFKYRCVNHILQNSLLGNNKTYNHLLNHPIPRLLIGASI